MLRSIVTTTSQPPRGRPSRLRQIVRWFATTCRARGAGVLTTASTRSRRRRRPPNRDGRETDRARRRGGAAREEPIASSSFTTSEQSPAARCCRTDRTDQCEFKRLWAKARRLRALGVDGYLKRHDALGVLELMEKENMDSN